MLNTFSIWHLYYGTNANKYLFDRDKMQWKVRKWKRELDDKTGNKITKKTREMKSNEEIQIFNRLLWTKPSIMVYRGLMRQRQEKCQQSSLICKFSCYVANNGYERHTNKIQDAHLGQIVQWQYGKPNEAICTSKATSTRLACDGILSIFHWILLCAIQLTKVA